MFALSQQQQRQTISIHTYNTKSLSGEGAEAASPISVLSLTLLWANTKALVLHITLAAVAAAGQINIEFTHL
jgi:hypothetical protein